jgi:hypothetical protein
MTNFQDPTGLGRAATVALWAYMIFKGLAAIRRFTVLPAAPPSTLLTTLYLIALIACYITVGCWIYRTNANAQLFSSEMSITPGWSIGWFFIPFANLVMPFRGVNETWQESHKAAGRYNELDSTLVGWWWGLWIATNIVSNIGAFMGGDASDAMNNAKYVNLVAAGISVASSLVLIQLMTRLNRVQFLASRGSVFA